MCIYIHTYVSYLWDLLESSFSYLKLGTGAARSLAARATGWLQGDSRDILFKLNVRV